MNRRLQLALVLVLAMTLSLAYLVAPASAEGATQISGVAYFPGPGACDDAVTGNDFALDLTGDLGGCLYVFVETAQCSPSGVYVETGTELYVGSGSEGDDGTFTTAYRFEAKYTDCANLVGEIHGRCQHPIVKRSGTGDYEDVTGRIDFKDDIAAENFPYRGHLRWLD